MIRIILIMKVTLKFSLASCLLILSNSKVRKLGPADAAISSFCCNNNDK